METIVRVLNGQAVEFIEGPGENLRERFSPEFVDSLVITDGKVEPGWLLNGDHFEPPPGIDFATVKAGALADLDNHGAAVRSRIIGPKETVYLVKAELAVLAMNGDDTSIELLGLEAKERGLPVDQFRDMIMTIRAVRMRQMMMIEAASARAKRGIQAAIDADGIRAAIEGFIETTSKIGG